jgi:hypothetical protein
MLRMLPVGSGTSGADHHSRRTATLPLRLSPESVYRGKQTPRARTGSGCPAWPRVVRVDVTRMVRVPRSGADQGPPQTRVFDVGELVVVRGVIEPVPDEPAGGAQSHRFGSPIGELKR